MLEAYCCQGEGKLYRLWFGDRVVAVDLCIKSAESLVILKTTYDESQQGYSPAFLMRHAAFADLFSAGGLARIEFYGKVMDWHKRWTDHWRTLYHINFYRRGWVREGIEAIARIRNRSAPRSQVASAGS